MRPIFGLDWLGRLTGGQGIRQGVTGATGSA
jgi:hypothetical protein